MYSEDILYYLRKDGKSLLEICKASYMSACTFCPDLVHLNCFQITPYFRHLSMDLDILIGNSISRIAIGHKTIRIFLI